MNSRERLLLTFAGQRADRVPVAPYLALNNVYEMFHYSPRMETFFDPPDFDLPVKFIEYCEAFGFDILHAGAYIHDSWTLDKPGENWDPQVTEEGDGEAKRKTLQIHTPGGVLRQVEEHRRSSPYLFVSAVQEYLIKSVQDFEILRKYAPPSDEIDCSLITRARAALGDRGLMDQPIHGVFNTASMFRKLDDLFIDPHTDPGFYHELMEFCTGWLINQCSKEIQAGAEGFDYGGNMATSAVGPKFFEKFVLPYEQRAIQALRQQGANVIYHNCGDAARIMHLYNRLEINCWGYVTPPPFGDVDLDEALAVIDPRIALRGNVDQVEFLVKATPDVVKEKVRLLLEKTKPRGNWVLSTTDFFFDGTPYENIRAFAEAGREFGVYS